MDYKFLDKVVDQILSETRIDDDKLYTPFSSFFFYLLSFPSLQYPFYSHCKNVYSIKDEQETEYVWNRYMEGIRTLIDKKELC